MKKTILLIKFHIFTMPPKDAKLMKNDRNKYETTQQTETYRQQDTVLHHYKSRKKKES